MSAGPWRASPPSNSAGSSPDRSPASCSATTATASSRSSPGRRSPVPLGHSARRPGPVAARDRAQQGVCGPGPQGRRRPRTRSRNVRESRCGACEFAPGRLSAWGLDYASVVPSNPGLIMAHVSGYGQDGPRAADRASCSVIVRRRLFARHGLSLLARSVIRVRIADRGGDRRRCAGAPSAFAASPKAAERVGSPPNRPCSPTSATDTAPVVLIHGDGRHPPTPNNVTVPSSVIAPARLGPTPDAEQHSARHQEVGRLGHDIEPRRRARAAACAQDQPGGGVPVGLEHELPGPRARRRVVGDLVA